jgi:Holliday junction resolvase RusA-like endonuclease
MPPSGNHRVRITRTGAHRTEAYSAFIEEAQQWARVARCEPLAGPVAARLTVYTRRANERDADNVVKPVLDALQGQCYLDDNQVKQLRVDMRVDRANPRVEVEIGPLVTEKETQP